MTCILDMTPSALAATVVPRAGKKKKNLLSFSFKEEEICYKMVWYETLHFGKTNRYESRWKEFTHMKSNCSGRINFFDV